MDLERTINDMQEMIQILDQRLNIIDAVVVNLTN